MAIGTDDAILKFGTQDEVTVAAPSSVTAGSYSVAADVNTWTNDDDAIYASFVLNLAFTTAPSAGDTVALYAHQQSVQSTNDAPVPDANYQHKYLGSFTVDAVGSSTEQYLVLSNIELPVTGASQVYEFYIKNNADQTINSSWDLYVTPYTVGPHA